VVAFGWRVKSFFFSREGILEGGERVKCPVVTYVGFGKDFRGIIVRRLVTEQNG
jgi:hypothetical protein